MKYLLLIATALLLGCASPEKAIYREAADGNFAPIIKDWKTWAPNLTSTAEHPNGQKDQIQLLTPAQYQNGLNTISEYEKLRDEDRARDPKGLQ